MLIKKEKNGVGGSEHCEAESLQADSLLSGHSGEADVKLACLNTNEILLLRLNPCPNTS